MKKKTGAKRSLEYPGPKKPKDHDLNYKGLSLMREAP
jgi:hypothetical protein